MSTSRARGAALVCALMLAAGARASRRLPPAIQRDLNLTYTIPCSLCHLDGNTGPGTARTPFAFSARARGLDANDVNALGAALVMLDTDKVDSDGDGVTDIDELRAGTDPNLAGPVPLANRVDPSYGCATGPGGASLGTLLTVLWLALAMRRRAH